MNTSKFFHKIAISLFSVACVCVASFSVPSRALSTTPGTVGEYGFYTAEAYELDNGEQISITPAGWFGVSLNLGSGSAFHLVYNFNDTYSGTLQLNVTTVATYKLEDCSFMVQGGIFQTVPGLTYQTRSKTFYIQFSHTDHIDFVISLPNDTLADKTFNDNTTFTMTFNMTTDESEYDLISDIDYQLVGMENTLTQQLNAIQSLADYQIDNESLLAYYFVVSNTDSMQVEYTNGDVSTAVNVTSSTYTRPIIIEPTSTYYFYFYTSANSLTFTPAHDDRANVSFEIVPPTMSGYRLVRATITSQNTSQSVTERFLWSADATIVPLYFGDGYGMSQAMQSITKYRSSNLTTDLLQQILDAINNGDDTDVDTTLYHTVINNVTSFLTSVVNIFPETPSGYDNFIDADIDALEPLSNRQLISVAGFVNSVYLQLVSVIPQFDFIVLFGLITIILKVFIL